MNISSRIKLNNGIEMPVIGMGTWKENPLNVQQTVTDALVTGFELIDAAKQYGNQIGVGKGIAEGLKQTGKKREDIFITSKVFNGDQGYDSTLKAFPQVLEDLGLEYLDLYLIHWPVPGRYKDTYRALEKLYDEGLVKAIGVSNFGVEQLEDLLGSAKVVPAINQMEFNPLEQEKTIKAFGDAHGIQLEAWSPLGGGQVLNNPTLEKIAKKYGKSVAQVILRWDLQREIITVPKSSHLARIQQNADVFDFELTAEDMNTINQMDQDKRSVWYNDFSWWDQAPEVVNDSITKWN